MTTATTANAPITPFTRNRLLVTLFTSVSIFNAAQILSFTLLPIAALFLTENEALAGIPSTLVLLGRAIIAYPIGWLMDKLGRRLGITLGFAFSVIGTSLCALSLGWGSFVGFCLGGLINGMGRGAGEQARYAAADVVAPERAASAISLIVWAGTVGSVVGPWLIASAKGWANGRGMVDLSGPYWWTAALSLVAGLIILLLLFPDPKQISRQWVAWRQPVNQPTNVPLRSQQTIFADPTVRLALITLVISQLVMTLIMVVNPLHMRHQHYADTDLSFVTMSHTLGMFALSWLTSILVTRLGKINVIALGAGVLIISAIIAPLAQGVWMLSAALFLLGYGWNLGYVAGSALLAGALAPGERPRTQGISETLVAGAATLGSYSTGPAFGWGGILAVSMIGLVFALWQLLAVVWNQRHVTPVVAGTGD